MPQRKRGGDETRSDDGDDAAAKMAPKRQRVSLACDTCRVVRERCDGVRPHCGTCAAQNRSCSYTPTARKRGVQTGYLRTIELSLAWMLFEESPGSEEALYRLLSNRSGLLQKKCKPADRLHKKWSKSRINKEIGRILSGDCPNNNSRTGDVSAGDSDTDGDGDGISVTEFNDNDVKGSSPIGPQSADNTERLPSDTVSLPKGWRRLVDIYFSYTHCWFPILDKSHILEAAAAYPANGIPRPNRTCEVAPRYAELWAVLAVSAYQDASSSNPSTNDIPPERIYAIARDMVPDVVHALGPPHLRAILLHSLVLIGQGDDLPAWMLVGTATRLALHLRTTGDLFSNGSLRNDYTAKTGVLTFAACLILDSLTSACVGQSACSGFDFDEVLGAVDSYIESESGEQWTSIHGFGSPRQDQITTSTVTRPLRTIRQLVRFSHVLNRSGMSQSEGVMESSPVVAEDLAKSLDPEYSFCNSVIFGGSTPSIPSAFLLQTAFLTTTTALIKNQRLSLLSSVLEVVESCTETFGSCGTPPVLVGYIGLAQSHGQVSKMHEAEKSKWKETLVSMKRVWSPAQNTGAHSSTLSADGYTPYTSSANQNLQPVPLQGGLGSADSTGYMQSGTLPVSPHNYLGEQQNDTQVQHIDGHPGTGYTLPRAHGQQRPSSHIFPAMALEKHPPLPRVPSFVNPTGLSFQAPGPVKRNPEIYNGENNFSGQPPTTDYDALLEELGSIDCGDGLETDPQFMTNLGFAPGCDIGDMFRGAGFGV